MTTASNIHLVDTLIGRAVLSRATANKVGHIHDLIVDAAKGELAGLVVQIPDQSLRSVDYNGIYSFGPDAVMVNSDESAVPVQDSPLKALPLAKHNLIGVNVVTEGGKLLGQIANVYIRLAETLLLIYEVRSSILDKLLGHSLYFLATNARAISGDFARIVVSEDTTAIADRSLNALEARLFGPPKEEDPVVIVRSRGY
ncbi:MAG: PRC-barrel domain-containing protein [Acidobacteriota bacterium]|nr:PRC-barrel domain-containing protein [Acidobacteriota bacterium]